MSTEDNDVAIMPEEGQYVRLDVEILTLAEFNRFSHELDPDIGTYFEEGWWFRNPWRDLLGVVTHVCFQDEWGVAILAPDETGSMCELSVTVNLDSREEAVEELRQAMRGIGGENEVPFIL